jgi:K+/H+ antiporter YhaU regulatory subunit KhtT
MVFANVESLLSGNCARSISRTLQNSFGGLTMKVQKKTGTMIIAIVAAEKFELCLAPSAGSPQLKNKRDHD